MDNHNYRGNSGYSDNDSRANNRGARPYQKRSNGYQQNGNGANRNFGNRKPYGNQQADGNQYGNRNNGYQANRGNYGSGNSGYNRSGQGYNRGGNNGGYGRPQYGNQNRGYNNNYGGRGGYQKHQDDYNQDQPQRPHYSKSGPKYTIDEQGYRHKRYWDHSDRKQKAFEAAAEREDDVMEHDGKIRLNKYLAGSGMCSRREADRMIKAGLVQVNGEVVTEMGVKVNYGDEVKYNGMVIKPEPKRYILLNKPKDYITTLKDPSARNTVMELIEGACKERVYPVGRLDRNTTGVLLFTNDGDLAKKLTHPSNEIQKIYHVSTDKPVSRADLQKIADGFELEDGFIAADEVAYTDERSGNRCEIGIRIHSGRNRIVRRIFEHLGYEVKKLDRVMFAGLDKKSLGRGKWRFLYENEIGYLHMISTKKMKDTSDADTSDAGDFED